MWGWFGGFGGRRRGFGGGGGRKSQAASQKKRAEQWFKEQQGVLNFNSRKSTVIGDKVAKVLEEVEKTGVGTFAVSDELKDAPITTIKLKKDGSVLRFPLEEAEMEALIPKLEMSPFGRGEKTLVDKSVRNSWQMNPAAFEITNKTWTKFITSVSSKIKEKLGITDAFVAKPYKLLLYKTGSFFKPHQDSEKEEGMFGTLVIQLPSKYTGGELIVGHGGSTKTFDHSTKGGGEEFLHYYSTFYCDCEHEVLPLESGVRACLIYNLVLKKRKDQPQKQVPAPALKKQSFEKILKEWRFNLTGGEEGDEEETSDDEDYDPPAAKRGKNEEYVPPHHSPRLIYLLAHEYSQQSLKYENLKGTDKTIANFLKEVAQDSEMIAFLGIMDRSLSCNTDGGEELGTDEENGKPTIKVKDLRVLAMDKDVVNLFPVSKLNCGKLEFEDAEVIPKPRLEKLKEHKSKVNYTGNEGTEITKQYKSSCILIMPTENLFFHCLESLDDKGAEKVFLAKFQKYKKAGNKEKEKQLLGKAFLQRQKTNSKSSYQDMMKWLKVFMEVGDKGLLSLFIKSYWIIINSDLKTFLSTVLSNRGKPLWAYLFEELNEQMKQLVSSPSSRMEMKAVPHDNFRSALEVVINTKDQSIISAFLQGYGQLLFVRMNETLPVIIGTRATIGDEFLRAELIKLFGNTNLGQNVIGEINWSSALDAIININDGENHLLSKFIAVCSRPIKKDLDKFLPILLQLRGKFGDQFIITELRKVFTSTPPQTVQHYCYTQNPGEKLLLTFRTLLQFKDANLMSDFISGFVLAITQDSTTTIPAILEMEALFGWTMVSDELKKIIIRLVHGHDPAYSQMQIVKQVLEKCNNGRQDVIESCIEYVKIIFEKCATWKDADCYTQRRFQELGLLAPKLNLDITGFLQSRNAPFIMKLLQDAAEKNGKKLNATWLKVGISGFQRMKASTTFEDKKHLPQLKILLAASGYRCE